MGLPSPKASWWDVPALYRDRQDAGRRLALALAHRGDSRAVVLGLPRGGVPVAFEVAAGLDAPLDLVFARKLGAPFNPQFAIGAVANGGTPVIVLNDSYVGSGMLPAGYVEEQVSEELKTIDRQIEAFLSGHRRIDIGGRTAILVDDGVASGATTRAALRAIRRHHPGRLILAVPVAPADTLLDLASDADEIVCLATPEPFQTVSQYYHDYRPVEDAEILALLGRAARRGAGEEIAAGAKVLR